MIVYTFSIVRSALPAESKKSDLFLQYFKPIGCGGRGINEADIKINIDNAAAFLAVKMMVGISFWIEPGLFVGKSIDRFN